MLKDEGRSSDDVQRWPLTKPSMAQRLAGPILCMVYAVLIGFTSAVILAVIDLAIEFLGRP